MAAIVGEKNTRGFRNALLLKGLEFEAKYPGMRLTRGPSVQARVKREFGLKGSAKSLVEQFRRLCEETGIAEYEVEK